MWNTDLLIVLLAVCGQSQLYTSQKTSQSEGAAKARASELAILAKQWATEYEFHLGTDRKHKLTLRAEPILRWTIPQFDEAYGSTFIWTSEGRPEVVACLQREYKPDFYPRVDEFQSLSLTTVTAQRDGRQVWFPSDAGVELRPIPGSHTPADSPAARLRQMRTLARKFSAEKFDSDVSIWQLRLLTQPIYRYEVTDPNLLDGAMFGFVMGTDPKVFLLIEARRTGDGYRWQYALARMIPSGLRVFHKGQKVWSVPILYRSQLQNRRVAYTKFFL